MIHPELDILAELVATPEKTPPGDLITHLSQDIEFRVYHRNASSRTLV